MKYQILTTKEMLAFCSSEILGIKFVFITCSEIEMAHNYLKERYSAAKTIPGTRGFHNLHQCLELLLKLSASAKMRSFVLNSI